MAVFELAGLSGLNRLSLVRVHKITDNAVFFLAEHATGLERLHLSYCDRLSLLSVMVLLRNLKKLEHLTATGIPSFKRKGVKRFSDLPPTVCAVLFFELTSTCLCSSLRFLLRHMTPTSNPPSGFSVVTTSKH